MDAEDEQAIRKIIGRALDASELETAETLEAISEPVATIVGKLAVRYRNLACKYLFHRVPGADVVEIMWKVEALEKRELARG